MRGSRRLQRIFIGSRQGPDIDAITTTSTRAAGCYAAGLRRLLRGSHEAARWLRRAVEADPGLGIAYAALALSLASGEPGPEAAETQARAVANSHLGTRRERQHIEIVGLVLSSDLGRARALAAEHLAEFPTDELIRHLVAGSGG